MAELLELVASWRALIVALVVFGFAPGFCLRLIVLIYPRNDPRRAELIAELYIVRRVQRPLWVAEQLEVALFEGLGHRISAALRKLSRRRRTLTRSDDEAVRKIEDDLERRKLIAKGAAVLFDTEVFGKQKREWTAQIPLPNHIGMAEAWQAEAAARAMRNLDYEFGGGACHDAVAAQLSWVQRLASASCQDDVRQRLLAVVADLQNLVEVDMRDSEV